MKQILVTTLILLSCTKEDITPQISINDASNEINQLTSTVSLHILMNTNVNDQPFDDTHLNKFSNYLYTNSANIIISDISAKAISRFIILQMEKGISHKAVSENIIKEFNKGTFQSNTR